MGNTEIEIKECRCSHLCGIETGWQCSGGGASSPDNCTEICGDGLDFRTLPCEDGNLLNGDG